MNNTIRRSIGATLILLLTVGPIAQAGVISTGAALQMQARQHQLERVDTFLARDDVRRTLIRHGVDPHHAKQRVNALTEAELARLAGRVDELPAGGVGVIEVLGITAVVLLVLELLGVTNVFTKI